MERIREVLGRGGIAVLAVMFALAFATFELANATAQAIVTAIQYELLDPDSGESPLAFRLGDTDIELSVVLQGSIAVLLLAGVLVGLWAILRTRSQVCPECLSEIPARASICRYCTSELVEAPTE